MRLWRLTRAPFAALDGKGAEMHGSRYAPPGHPVVSLASEAGLAVLVAQRYLPQDSADWPQDFVLGWTEIDTDPERISGSDEDSLRRQVGEWIEQGQSLTCAIRSKVLPEADVIYLNPHHHDAVKVPPLTTRPFSFEECLHRPPMLDAFRRAQ